MSAPEPEQRDEPEANDAAEGPAAASAATPSALSLAVRATAITTVVMTVGAALGVDLGAAAGVFVGGALATANLALFVKLGAAFLAQRGQSAPWVALGGVKMLALFACVFILLRRGDVSALALACGYGALPIGITVSTLFRRPDPAEGPRAG